MWYLYQDYFFILTLPALGASFDIRILRLKTSDSNGLKKLTYRPNTGIQMKRKKIGPDYLYINHVNLVLRII